ncbi:hypothetical protein GCM10027289_31330 [Tsukamurella serpentis]
MANRTCEVAVAEQAEVVVDTRVVLDRDLDRAFGFDSGPVKEREINRLVVDLITGLVRDAWPDAREIWLELAPVLRTPDL